MYRIYVDNELFSDSRIDDLMLINPVVTLEANNPGSFTFTIPAEHPKKDLIKRRKSIISVFRDVESTPVFQGFCVEETTDFNRQRKVKCEGELSYLNDSVQRQAKYQGVTVLELFTEYIKNHNSQVDDYKKFEIGEVTVTDHNDYIYCFTNMQSTMTEIKEDLVDDYGGFVRVRYDNGKKRIDYINDSPRISPQTIELGKNLIDFTSNIDCSDIATVVIPLGAKLDTQEVEGLDARLTVKSVNDDKDYIENTIAVSNYGRIVKVVKWDDVTTPSELKTKCEKYIKDYQFDNVVVQAKAVDFGYFSNKIEKFQMLDSVRIVSEKHGMDRYFMLTKMKLNLNNPENDVFTFGKTIKVSLTVSANSSIGMMQREFMTLPQDILNKTSSMLETKVGKDENDTIISMINAAAEIIKLTSNRFSVKSDNLEITEEGKVKCKDLVITGGKMDVSTDVTIYQKDYTEDDVETLRQILLGRITPTDEQIDKYDLDGDGFITLIDIAQMTGLIKGVGVTNGKKTYTNNLKIDPSSRSVIIRTKDVRIGRKGLSAKTIGTNDLYINNGIHVKADDNDSESAADGGYLETLGDGTYTIDEIKTITVKKGIVVDVKRKSS